MQQTAAYQTATDRLTAAKAEAEAAHNHYADLYRRMIAGLVVLNVNDCEWLTAWAVAHNLA